MVEIKDLKTEEGIKSLDQHLADKSYIEGPGWCQVDEEAEKVRQERLQKYAEKKSKKPGPIAKSNVILDVKPWDDETDMKEMERLVRTIETDGLNWGASKLVPLAFGINKLTIVCVVEDEKLYILYAHTFVSQGSQQWMVMLQVSIDWLSEEIEKFEDYVQSVDVAAFQKI
ncbi:EEF1B2 [Cordylochernes scorpioides]|uniref:EEF1B2 n=1 Tax=Cordylochernes scorpioides TaxID=51811 RepID=A0ABY6KDE8_9ARAC|nr:EEF1B2 [Cordylochernes scorpioides]